jgi:hypothetical protein
MSKPNLTGGLLMLFLSLPSVSTLAADAAADASQQLSSQCQLAYRQEDLPFVLTHCPEQAWSLARAHCEREADTVAAHYVEFCHQFYTGAAPTYGN